MDGRLVLWVLMVTLSWGLMGTYATNATTPAGITSSANMTIPVNATDAPATTTPMGMTNATTAPMGMTNATTAPMGMTNATTAVMGGTNATTAVMGGTNATTSVTTAAPSLISRADCGSRKLCAEAPSKCNPAAGAQCIFFAAVLKGNQSFEIELSGETNGYIASVLSPDATRGGNDKTYMCANSNGAVKLFEALFDNNQLKNVNESKLNVSGNTRGGKIQCIFEAPVPTPTTRATVNTNFSVSVLTGDFNATSQTFGAPTPKIETNVVNLANPNATAINQLNNSTTSAPMTTSHGVTLQQPLIQALLVTVGALVFSMLQGN